MSKMREALRDLLRRYENENQCYPGARPNQLIDEIAQRYGDLEFTREEVRGMFEELENALRKPRDLSIFVTATYLKTQIDHILSRHTEAEGCSHPDQVGELGKLCQGDKPTREDYLIRADDILREKRSDRYGPDGKRASESGDEKPTECGHSEPEPLPDGYYDKTPTIKASEIERLSKRLAAIEKRVLFEGHSQNCEKRLVGQPGVAGARDICTCHYDEIQTMRNKP